MRVELAAQEVRLDAAKFSGYALRPGTWTGIDGHTITYPPEIFDEDHIVFRQHKVKLGHVDGEEAVVGFITRYKLTRQGLWIQGYIFEPSALEALRKGIRGLSIEAEVDVGPMNIARNVSIDAVSLVKTPAVENAEVRNVETVRLQKPGESEMSVETTPNAANVTVTFEATAANPVEVENAKKLHPLTKWLKNLLRKHKIEKDLIDRIAEIVEQALQKGEYPYPKPTVKNEKLEAKLEEYKAKLEKLQKDLAAKEKELQEVKLSAKIHEIKEIDPDFAPEKIPNWNELDFKAKLAALDSYAEAAKKATVPVSKPEGNDELSQKVLSTLKMLGIEVEK